MCSRRVWSRTSRIDSISAIISNEETQHEIQCFVLCSSCLQFHETKSRSHCLALEYDVPQVMFGAAHVKSRYAVTSQNLNQTITPMWDCGSTGLDFFFLLTMPHYSQSVHGAVTLATGAAEEPANLELPSMIGQ